MAEVDSPGWAKYEVLLCMFGPGFILDEIMEFLPNETIEKIMDEMAKAYHIQEYPFKTEE